jgi:hypothetical protein
VEFPTTGAGPRPHALMSRVSPLRYGPPNALFRSEAERRPNSEEQLYAEAQHHPPLTGRLSQAGHARRRGMGRSSAPSTTAAPSITLTTSSLASEASSRISVSTSRPSTSSMAPNPTPLAGRSHDPRGARRARRPPGPPGVLLRGPGGGPRRPMPSGRYHCPAAAMGSAGVAPEPLYPTSKRGWRAGSPPTSLAASARRAGAPAGGATPRPSSASKRCGGHGRRYASTLPSGWPPGCGTISTPNGPSSWGMEVRFRPAKATSTTRPRNCPSPPPRPTTGPPRTSTANEPPALLSWPPKPPSHQRIGRVGPSPDCEGVRGTLGLTQPAQRCWPTLLRGAPHRAGNKLPTSALISSVAARLRSSPALFRISDPTLVADQIVHLMASL